MWKVGANADNTTNQSGFQADDLIEVEGGGVGKGGELG